MPNLNHLAILHGTLTSIPIVLLFPLAAILLRTLPPLHPSYPKPVSLHRRLQWVGWLLYLTGSTVGVVATAALIKGKGMRRDFGTNPHIILGAMVSILLLGQPVWGEIHHWTYRSRDRVFRERRAARAARNEHEGQNDHAVESKPPGRTWVTWLHVVGGRVLILLGMVNGGLGLMITRNAPFRHHLHQLVGTVLYAVTTGAMGLWYMWVVARFERDPKKEKRERVYGMQQFGGLDSHSVNEHGRDPDREVQMMEAQHPEASRLATV